MFTTSHREPAANGWEIVTDENYPKRWRLQSGDVVLAYGPNHWDMKVREIKADDRRAVSNIKKALNSFVADREKMRREDRARSDHLYNKRLERERELANQAAQ